MKFILRFVMLFGYNQIIINKLIDINNKLTAFIFYQRHFEVNVPYRSLMNKQEKVQMYVGKKCFFVFKNKVK